VKEARECAVELGDLATCQPKQLPTRQSQAAILDQPARQVRYEPHPAGYGIVAILMPVNLNKSEFRVGSRPNHPRYPQLWVLLGDVSERRGLPSDDNIVGLMVDELEHEAPTIGRIELKVAIALAVQRRGARGQAVEG
jgi:hypothetical protein